MRFALITKFILLQLILVFICQNSKAALPFVTDDANIQKPKQLALETFAERWDIPAKHSMDKEATTLYGYFLSGSYGLSEHLELTMAGNIGYDAKKQNASYMNPILQLKTKIYTSQDPAIPSVAIDFGYVNKNGSGEYFDPATNYYAIGAFTNKLFDDKLVTHFNIGKKASYDIPGNHFERTHLGIAFDINLIDKFQLVIESYNGAPNSPRDSPNYFQSWQTGIKYIKSNKLSIYTIYGTQPTFVGYDDSNKMTYRTTSWIQVGARIVFDAPTTK